MLFKINAQQDQHDISQLLDSNMKAFLFLLAVASFTLVAAQEPQRCSKYFNYYWS
jgi:hypothetical protein